MFGTGIFGSVWGSTGQGRGGADARDLDSGVWATYITPVDLLKVALVVATRNGHWRLVMMAGGDGDGEGVPAVRESDAYDRGSQTRAAERRDGAGLVRAPFFKGTGWPGPRREIPCCTTRR